MKFSGLTVVDLEQRRMEQEFRTLLEQAYLCATRDQVNESSGRVATMTNTRNVMTKSVEHPRCEPEFNLLQSTTEQRCYSCPAFGFHVFQHHGNKLRGHLRAETKLVE